MSNLIIPTTDITIDMSTVTGIALSFSGGPDSTLLAYILAKYKYEIDNDFPLRFVNWQVKNFDEYLTPRVEKIIEWIKSHYNVDIDFSILQIQRELIKPGVDWRTLPVKVVEDFEQEAVANYYRDLHKNTVYSHSGSAQNVHMPKQLAKELYADKWQHGWREERNPKLHVARPPLTVKSFQPFYNLLKKELFDIADSYGIVDDLMELTNSCNRAVENTVESYHCGECYHCIERHWAYGRY